MTILEDTRQRIHAADADARAKARARLEQLTMPHWALGRLMDLAEDLAGMTGQVPPPVSRACIVVMAGDHGVVKRGVSRFPQEVTPQMVHNFVRGGAGINALANAIDARVVVVDMGMCEPMPELVASGALLDCRVGSGTADMGAEPAMSREQALASIEHGIGIAQRLAGEVDVFGTGEMGIGNTTPSAAICAVLTGRPVADVTGCGTGIDEAARLHKIAVIEGAIRHNAPEPNDALDVLAKVGGFEIGGLAGLILGAASLQKPVVVDGFISTAAAMLAHALAPASADYMVAAHRSVEPGHAAMLGHLGKTPFLDLGMRLGEGTGAAVAMHLLRCAARILADVATFEEAAVSEADG